MKSRWIALVCSLLVVGGGHLYVGRFLRFTIAVLTLLSVWLVLIFGSYLSTFDGFLLAALNLFSFLLFALIDPLLIARKVPVGLQSWYAKPPVFLAYFIAMPFVLTAINDLTLPPNTSADRLGFDVYCANSDAMVPTILQGDCLLVDTWAYRRHSPVAGDIVVARASNGTDEYVRRISAVDGGALLTANQVASTSEEFLNNVEVPFSRIRGPVTYILYADDLKRVGTQIRN